MWFFGPGSTPPTAIGDTATTQYTTLGRKNLSVIVNGQTYTFYEYIDIRDDGTGTNPTFTQSRDTLCVGGQVTFTSSINTAQLYAWDFGGGASYVWLYADVRLPHLHHPRHFRRNASYLHALLRVV